MSVWLAMALLFPSGMSAGLSLVALPYLLSKQGAPLHRVGATMALATLPYAWKLLLGPLVDLWMRRRSWYLLMTIVAALDMVLLCTLFQRGLTQSVVIDGLLVLMSLSGALADNAVASLCATLVRKEQQGRASSFFAIGQTCWYGVLGALILMLIDPPQFVRGVFGGASLLTIGVGCALAMVAMGSLSLFLPEPQRVRGEGYQELKVITRDAWDLVRSREGWAALLVSSLPLGTAAVMNLQNAMAQEYHATAQQVAFFSGIGSTLTSIIGSLIAGALVDRYERRVIYIGTSLALGAFSMFMAVLPATPLVYCCSLLIYGLVSGACYASFFAYVFGLARGRAAATTAVGLYCGAGSLAITYMTFLEGWAYAFGGRVGLYMMDAWSNILGVLVCIMLLYGTRTFWVRARA